MPGDPHIENSSLEKPGNFVLIGSVSCGKTALIQALLDIDGEVLKTQAAIFHDNNVIDIPGEFIGRRNYYSALLATIVDVPTIVYLQAANSTSFSMPAGLLRVYPHKNVVGVISKVDLPDADINAASQVLQDNGIAEPHFATSAVTGFGVPALRRHLVNLCHNGAEPASPIKPPEERENAA